MITDGDATLCVVLKSHVLCAPASSLYLYLILCAYNNGELVTYHTENNHRRTQTLSLSRMFTFGRECIQDRALLARYVLASMSTRA